VLCDVDEAGVTQAAAGLPGRAIGVKTNVTSADDIAKLFGRGSQEFQRVDIVVNNAGITRDGLMVRMDEKDWDLVLDINLKGAFLVTKAAGRIMMNNAPGGLLT